MTAIEEDPEVQAALWGLYYSIYYAPNAVELINDLPRPVVDAYARVQLSASSKQRSVARYKAQTYEQMRAQGEDPDEPIYLADQFDEINAMAPYEDG
jgi:hypothetical protein